MAANPFDTPAMALGYARSRPAVHPRVVERILERLGGRRFQLAVDVGCGAGLSTAALEPLASQSIGLEPSLAMLQCARAVAPRAFFAAAPAESLPLRDACAGLITAAGSLNWADLDRFFPEARRVLAPAGLLIVYDFGQGRVLLNGDDSLGRWEDEFKRRYPSPPCREITPAALDLPRRGFRLQAYQDFRTSLTLSKNFYLDYAMTETNVAAAIDRGEPEPDIRQWCRATLEDVFAGGSQNVVFEGFIAYIAVEGSQPL